MADGAFHSVFFPFAGDFVVELVGIETGLFGFVADSQAHEGRVLEREQEDARDDEGVGEGGANVGQLVADLDTVAVDGAAVFAAETVE